jgi:hypothetical protein
MSTAIEGSNFNAREFRNKLMLGLSTQTGADEALAWCFMRNGLSGTVDSDGYVPGDLSVAGKLFTNVGSGSGFNVRGVVNTNQSNLAAFTVASADGVTYVEGNRVLLAGQSTGSQNGIYTVGVVGGGTAALTRATDYDATTGEATSGDVIYVAEGEMFADTIWVNTTGAAITIGTTAMTFGMVEGLRMATRRIVYTDLTDADGSQTFTFKSVLPRNAMPLDCFIDVKTAFTDGSTGVFTMDVGVNGGDTDALIDGAALGTLGKVCGPKGVGLVAWGNFTICVLALGSVNLNTATAGDCYVYVPYLTFPLS